MMKPSKNPDPYAVEGAKAPAKPGAPAKPEAAAAGAKFSATVVDGVHVIRFEQSRILDAHEIEQLGDEVYHHLKPVDAPKVVIDMGNVEHLSSAALGMLIALRKVVVEKKGGGIGIANVSKGLESIFKMTKLDKLLKISDSTEKAMRRLQ